MATEREGVATMRGNPLTLLGDEVKVGDKAPEFKLVSTAMEEVTLGDSAGKVRILSSVPSLDTPVCQIQTKRFNEELAALGDDVEVITISADLPFAQGRFCGTEKIKHTTLSDHKDMNFGDAYGVHIKDMRIDHRAVFVVGKDDVIKHAEYVKEMAEQPDYDAVLEAAKKAVAE